jgi:hypothetical protein
MGLEALEPGRRGRDGALDLAGSQILVGHGLVVDDEIQDDPLPPRDLPNGFQKPRVQAVGVDGQAHGHEVRRVDGHEFFKEAFFENLELTVVAQHGHARGRGPDRGRAHHEHLPDRLLELADALGNSGLRQKQGLCRLFEALFGNDRRQGVQMF